MLTRYAIQLDSDSMAKQFYYILKFKYFPKHLTAEHALKYKYIIHIFMCLYDLNVCNCKAIFSKQQLITFHTTDPNPQIAPPNMFLNSF